MMPYRPPTSHSHSHSSSSSPEPHCPTRCLAALPPHAFPRRQLYRSMAASQTLLSQIYDSGAPIFTKAALVDVAAQIDAAVADPAQQPMRVTGLDGKVVEFPLLTGRAHHVDDAHICILSAARLLDACRDDTLFHPIRAHLPLEIAHLVEKRLAVSPPRRFLDDFLPTDDDANSLRFHLHMCRARLLLRALVSALPPRRRIRNVVALACGSPETTKTKTAVGRRRSVMQHALMLALRDALGNSGGGGGGVVCVAQDAGFYTATDKEVLEGERVAVVDDPRGYLEVGNETVVVAVWPGNVPVWDVVCDVARPAVLAWHQDAEWSGNHGQGGDPASSRVRNMLRDEYVKVPTPPEDDWLDEVALYVRKEE